MTAGTGDFLPDLAALEARIERENFSMDTFVTLTSPAVRRFFRYEEVWPSGGVSLWSTLTSLRSSPMLDDDTRICIGCFAQLTLGVWSSPVVTIDPYSEAANRPGRHRCQPLLLRGGARSGSLWDL